jgi:hypothetical protein
MVICAEKQSRGSRPACSSTLEAGLCHITNADVGSMNYMMVQVVDAAQRQRGPDCGPSCCKLRLGTLTADCHTSDQTHQSASAMAPGLTCSKAALRCFACLHAVRGIADARLCSLQQMVAQALRLLLHITAAALAHASSCNPMYIETAGLLWPTLGQALAQACAAGSCATASWCNGPVWNNDNVWTVSEPKQRHSTLLATT